MSLTCRMMKLRMKTSGASEAARLMIVGRLLVIVPPV